MNVFVLLHRKKWRNDSNWSDEGDDQWVLSMTQLAGITWKGAERRIPQECTRRRCPVSQLLGGRQHTAVSCHPHQRHKTFVYSAKNQSIINRRNIEKRKEVEFGWKWVRQGKGNKGRGEEITSDTMTARSMVCSAALPIILPTKTVNKWAKGTGVILWWRSVWGGLMYSLMDLWYGHVWFVVLLTHSSPLHHGH